MTVGTCVPERGVSSKLIPGHPDEFVGLSVECGDVTETYPFCFDAEGNVLQKDTVSRTFAVGC